MSRLALAAVLASATFCLGACDDPQHGAYRVNRFLGFWSLTLIALGGLVFGLAVGYFGHRLWRRVRAS